MFSDIDDFDPHEMDDLIEASRQALAKDIENHIRKNKCEKVKEIGDQVLVWDTSRLRYADDDQPVTDQLDLNIIVLHPSIVVKTRETYQALLELGDRQYNVQLDLVIWNKTINRTFRTSSNFVKIV